MKQIPSESICNFFYAFFVIYAVIAALALVATIGFFGLSKKLGGYGIGAGLGYLFTMVLAGTQALFFYLICDRALLATKQAKPTKQVAPMY